MNRANICTIGFILLAVGVPVSSGAAVFWTDDFENHLMPNWDTSACGSQKIDGCDPGISTDADMAHSGTHSFKSHFANMYVQAGTYIDRYFPQTQHLYTRFYYKTRTGFQYYTDGVTKHFFHTSDAGAMDTVWLNRLGDRTMLATINHPATVTCPQSDRGGMQDISCNYVPNLRSVPLNDNQWYCIETHVYTGSPNKADGVLEQWINGVQTMSYSGLLMRTGSAGYTFVRHYAQNGQGDRYIDDLAVGDTRIGCGTLPSTSTTPPATPTGLVVR